MEPKFKIDDVLKYADPHSNQSYRGRVIGVDADHLNCFTRNWSEVGTPVRTGFTYTLLCTCCDSTKRIGEQALVKAEEN